jgi:hypothetical protein
MKGILPLESGVIDMPRVAPAGWIDLSFPEARQPYGLLVLSDSYTLSSRVVGCISMGSEENRWSF